MAHPETPTAPLPPPALAQWVPVLWRSRYSILSLGVGAIFLIVPGQSIELLQALVEGGHGGHRGRYLVVVFALASAAWAVTTWYSARLLLSFRFDGEVISLRAELPLTRSLAEWLPRVLGSLTYLVTAIALVDAFAVHRGAPDARWVGGRLLLLAGAWLAMGVLFFLGVAARRRMLVRALQKVPPTVLPAERKAMCEALSTVPVATRRFGDLDRTSRIFIIAPAAALVALGIGFAASPVRLAPLFGTLSILILALSVWMPLATVIAYWSHRTGVPISLALLALLLVSSLWNDNHALRRAGPPAARSTFARHLRCWRDPAGSGNPLRGPVILVAAEGGGIRAAYYTAAVLARFQDLYPDFSRHLFAISSVSGGSLGAATFASLIARGPAADRPGEHGKAVQRVLGRDFLAPTVAMLLFPDFLQRFLPVPFPVLDRARGMELSWERAFQRGAQSGAFAAPLSQLWQTDASYTVPSLLLNATWVERGKRFLISPTFLGDGDLFGDAVDGLTSIQGDVPLSTAAHLSARFPYVSPLARIDGFGHVADGGYFENSGAATLLEVVNALATESVIPLAIVLRYRDGSESERSVSLAPGGSDSAATNRFLLELLGPPVALLKSREAHASFSVEALQRRLTVLGGQTRLVELRDDGGVLPLGWTLSERARRAIDDQVAQLDLGFLEQAGLVKGGSGGPKAAEPVSTECAPTRP